MIQPTRLLLAAAAGTALALPAHAAEVKTAAEVSTGARVVFDFGDLASKENQQLSRADQPYALDGVTFPDLFVAKPATPLAGSGGLALRSAGIEAAGNASVASIELDGPRSIVSMQYRDQRATSIVFTAFDDAGAKIESFTRPGGDGYAGFKLTSARIAKVTVSAPHASAADADASRLFLDDVLVSLDEDQGGKGTNAGGCASGGLAWTGALGLAALLRRRRAGR